MNVRREQKSTKTSSITLMTSIKKMHRILLQNSSQNIISQMMMEEVCLAVSFYPLSNVAYFDITTGKHATWLPHVDKLVLEMLVNRTLVTSIQAIVLAMSKILLPNTDVVQELRSLSHIMSRIYVQLSCY